MGRFVAGVLIACVVMINSMTSTALASGTFDGELIYATPPAEGLGSTVGIGIGGTLDLSSSEARTVRTVVRGDMSYFVWDGSGFGSGVTYTRTVFFVGPRLCFGAKNEQVTPYLEVGPELSLDNLKMGVANSTDSEFGVAGGGGVNIALSERAMLSINARYHAIDDDFLSVAFSIGFVF